MSRTTRILVSGGDGILAQALRPYFPMAVYCGKREMDVTNAGHVKDVFREAAPEIVIHAAAITRHDADPLTYVVNNVQGTINVVAATRKCGARLVYLSTDYLGARHEGDPVRPVSAYAASKYAGELCVGSYGASLSVRGSWYSRLDLSHAATDALTSRIPVSTAAHWIAVLSTSTHTGVVNIGGARRSIYEIALQFNPAVIPISRTQIKCGYTIPADCSLDTTRLTRLLAA